MAKSLVERLNSWSHDPMAAAASDLMEEAANAIEDLQERVASLQSQVEELEGQLESFRSVHIAPETAADAANDPERDNTPTLTDKERELLKRVRGGMLLLATFSTQHSEGSFMADAAGIGAVLERLK